MTAFVTDNLTAQVDGVNKVFTSTQSIQSIALVNFDGTPYFDYTFSGTTITLTDAPTDSLYVTYLPVSATGVGSGLTVSDAIAILKRHYSRDIGEVSNELYYDWLNELNYLAYRAFYNINAEAYISEFTINVVSGTDTYALPGDFKNILVASIGNSGGCGFFPIENGTQSNVPLEMTGFASSNSGYYLKGKSNVVLTPEPTAATTLTLRYIPQLAELTATSDQMVIEKEHIVSVMNWLDKSYGQWNLDIFKENSGDQRFIRGFSSVLNDQNPDSLIFDMT